jgi:hypothetical protein
MTKPNITTLEFLDSDDGIISLRDVKRENLDPDTYHDFLKDSKVLTINKTKDGYVKVTADGVNGTLDGNQILDLYLKENSNQNREVKPQVLRRQDSEKSDISDISDLTENTVVSNNSDLNGSEAAVKIEADSVNNSTIATNSNLTNDSNKSEDGDNLTIATNSNLTNDSNKSEDGDNVDNSTNTTSGDSQVTNNSGSSDEGNGVGVGVGPDANNKNIIAGGKKSRRRGGMKKAKQNKSKRVKAMITRRRLQKKKGVTKRR